MNRSSGLLTGALRFGAPPSQTTAGLVLVHGRGASPEAIAVIARRLPTDHVACVAPRASEGTWYPLRFLAAREANEPSLSLALSTVQAAVDELAAAGIARERIGLIGFSQGACLVLEHALQAATRYGFIAGLSGAMIGPLEDSRTAPTLDGTPVLIACAEHDTHIPRPHVEATAALFRSSGADVTHLVFPGDTHGVFPEEVAWLQEHTQRLIPG
jgi:predicted esterase